MNRDAADELSLALGLFSRPRAAAVRYFFGFFQVLPINANPGMPRRACVDVARDRSLLYRNRSL